MATNRQQIYLMRFLAVIVAANLLLLGWVGFISLPLWRISTITIVGNDYVPVPRIMEKLTLPQKTSLWRVSSGSVHKMFKDDPWMQRVVVRRQFPQTLIVETTIRQPYFQLLIGDRSWYIDEAGKILNHDGITPAGTPCYAVVGVTSIAEIPEVVATLVPLTKNFNKVLESGKVRIDFSRKNDIHFYFDGVQIKVGDTTAQVEKSEALTYVLGALGERIRRVVYIDIRAYKTPAVRFR